MDLVRSAYMLMFAVSSGFHAGCEPAERRELRHATEEVMSAYGSLDAAMEYHKAGKDDEAWNEIRSAHQILEKLDSRLQSEVEAEDAWENARR